MGSIAALLSLVAGCTAQAPAAEPARATQRFNAAHRPAPSALRLVWSQATTPTRAAAPTRSDLAELVSLCGTGDGALDEVARILALGQAEGLPPPDVEQFTLALRAAGSPLVWPRTWSLAGRLDHDTTRQRMAAWLEMFDDGGERYCGLALASAKGSQTEILVIVAVDAIATLNASIPNQARSGTWITVDAKTLVDSADAKVVVLAPTGRPYTVPTSVNGGRVLGRVRVDRAGMWKLQVLTNTDTGPRPALETVVWVDREPPAFAVEERAPGEGRADPSRAADEQLFEMLRALRAAEGLGPVIRVPWLDTLAQEHSEAMMRAQHLGHDVGHGGPQARAARALSRARRTGENVAHAASVVRAHRTLWASPSHRGNLVDPHFNAVGLGVARGPDGTLWITQEFAEI